MRLLLDILGRLFQLVAQQSVTHYGRPVKVTLSVQPASQTIAASSLHDVDVLQKTKQWALYIADS
jgi:hypothetical protein